MENMNRYLDGNRERLDLCTRFQRVTQSEETGTYNINHGLFLNDAVELCWLPFPIGWWLTLNRNVDPNL